MHGRTSKMEPHMLGQGLLCAEPGQTSTLNEGPQWEES